MDSDSDNSGSSVESVHREIVNRLYEFGDSLLDDDGYKEMKKKTKKKKTKMLDMKDCTLNIDSERTGVKRKKKKKKLKSESEVSDTQNLQESKKDKLCKRSKLQAWRDELELDTVALNQVEGSTSSSKIESMVGNAENDVKTRKRKAPEIIVFEDRKKKQSKKPDRNMEEAHNDGEQMSLKEARREVRDFGVSGFSYKDKKQFEEQRAIKLGAKPPKREYVNYKKYMDMQKEKKQAEMQQRDLDRKMGLKVSKKSSDKRDPMEGKFKRFGFWTDSSLERSLDGQIGRYRHGVQVLRKTDIETIKKTRVKK